MAEFALHVLDIDEAGKDYAFALSPAWIDSQLKEAVLRMDPAFGPGSLHVHVQENSANEYLVTGTLRAHLLTDCGRCLGDAKVPVDVELATLFARAAFKKSDAGVKRPNPRHERYEVDHEDEDDQQREEFSGHDIVLDDLVRELIVLEVPMQPLCSESCEGIPVPAHVRPPEETFGGQDAVDPRLAPLQRLRDNVPPKSQQRQPAPQSTQKPNRNPGQKPGPNSEKE